MRSMSGGYIHLVNLFFLFWFIFELTVVIDVLFV